MIRICDYILNQLSLKRSRPSLSSFSLWKTPHNPSTFITHSITWGAGADICSIERPRIQRIDWLSYSRLKPILGRQSWTTRTWTIYWSLHPDSSIRRPTRIQLCLSYKDIQCGPQKNALDIYNFNVIIDTMSLVFLLLGRKAFLTPRLFLGNAKFWLCTNLSLLEQSNSYAFDPDANNISDSI